MARQYDQAIEHSRATLELDPDFVQAHRVLSLADLYGGHYEVAISELQKAVQPTAADPVPLALLARAYALSGRAAEARNLLRELEELSKQRYVSPADIAVLRGDLGEKDEAFQWLGKAYEERSNFLINLKVDPAFDSLRSDPRFAALSARIGLPP
jgi:tetratricopeptide (TPR) repeat protein